MNFNVQNYTGCDQNFALNVYLSNYHNITWNCYHSEYEQNRHDYNQKLLLFNVQIGQNKCRGRKKRVIRERVLLKI